MQEMKNAYKTFVTKCGIKIPVGRHKWKNNIQMDV
jgi:hypothetical protein